MANLAIKGHPTRGKEVIQLLEMLGGIAAEAKGFRESYCYYISEDTATKYISWDYIGSEEIEKYKIFTLEEFLEKYPYKVGDKVKNRYGSSGKVYQMKWIDDEIQYRLDFGHHTSGWYSAENLQPYKEETMEEKRDKAKAPNLVGEDYSGKRFGYKIPQGYEVDCIQNNEIIIKPIKPQYPETYEECCTYLGLQHCGLTIDLPLNYSPPFISLAQLYICRNAYWKIAGEQMGLSKSWKPDWGDYGHNAKFKYTITTIGNNIARETSNLRNYILAFPTEEMRDVFYENFKNLIEQCKELL